MTAGSLGFAAKRTLATTGILASRLAFACTSIVTAATRGLDALSVNGKGAFAGHFIIYI